MTEFSMRNFFNWTITLLTCIGTCAICLDMSQSFTEICAFPIVEAGILRTAPRVANSFFIKNTLSARTQSPNVTLSKKPDFSDISLSEALPSQLADKKLTATDGVIPTRYLMVFLDL